ncbi:hypothetical protein [Frondihabitans cladoniiphilus]|uniref:Uncharacterized protein n=1 Tax=Frondihabitans cladoniiphilus TaxID=715785 RepID=A0ABP8VMS4_9MICO
MTGVGVASLILGIIGIVLGAALLLWRQAKLRRGADPRADVEIGRRESSWAPPVLLGRGIGFLAAGIAITIVALTGAVR